MKYKTVKEYRDEIERVRGAMEKTSSPTLRRDYEKYMYRLTKEARLLGTQMQRQKGGGA